MSVVTGIICSALLFFLSNLYTIGARKKTIAYLELLETYIRSISNDLIWGTEDFKESYYDNIIVKINFVLLYINEIKNAIKPFNFIWHKRKYVLFQIDEIDRFVKKCFTNVVCATPDKEKVFRMQEMKNEFSAEVDFILLHRIEFALELLKNLRNIDDAIEKCSVGNDVKDYEIIKRELKRINKEK